jgi:hypothetical protein
MVQRLVSLDTTACFNTANLCQVHEFFVWCSVETRRDMGLSVVDNVRCPKSRYSIDILVHAHGNALETGGKRSSGRVWAVDFAGHSHFLASGAPKGATLLKRRHLELPGHALVSVPYWEWDGCKGAGEREEYLNSKLAECGDSAAQGQPLLRTDSRENMFFFFKRTDSMKHQSPLLRMLCLDSLSEHEHIRRESLSLSEQVQRDHIMLRTNSMKHRC